jgi:hypothetical protein
MQYKKAVAALLQSRSDAGMTNQEIACALKLKNGNVVSMHMNPTDNISPFPLTRLPALARLCGLSPMECLKLIDLRAFCHPKNPTCFDRGFMRWMLGVTRGAVEQRNGRPYEDVVARLASHGV